MKKIMIFTLIAAAAFGGEPSAFGAGDLNSPNPYGLTSAEKKIYETDKNLQNISKTVITSEQSQTELRTEVEGLKSLLSGHDEKIRLLSAKLSALDTSMAELKNDLNISLSTVQTNNEQNIKLQNENYDKIMKAISSLGGIIDKINEEYVSRSELKAVFPKSFKDTAKQPKSSEKNESSLVQKDDAMTPAPDASKSSMTVQNNDSLFAAAMELYKKNKLQEARVKFAQLAQSGYKKESVYYYIGECDYKSGNYKVALENFQASVEADDKSMFVPIILFHTSICLEKLDDKEGAKKILSSLIENYPKHWLAAPAKKRLSDTK